MKFIVSGKNIEVTDALRERAVKKLGKLEKFFDKDTEVDVTFSVEKARQILEVTIYFRGMVIRAEVSNHDMYASIDKAVDVVERQVRRNKTRLQKKLHTSSAVPEFFMEDKKEADEEHEFNVVRSKKFAIKPMTVDEAILQMNLLGHEFFVFSNSDTEEVNVVYKRKIGNYGLIEPEF